MRAPAGRLVRAAGVVCFRRGQQVLLVHRPKYDDWSFPRGKLDRGEHAVVAAVREAEEETGLHVRLGPPLADQRYPITVGEKIVHYWTARVVGDDDTSTYVPNEEIDLVEWVPYDEAMTRLTYAHDKVTLKSARRLRRKTRPVVVLRHAQARSRKAWRDDDRLRPLLVRGRDDAFSLVPMLAAYDVSEVVSSTSTRCLQTVEPYAETVGLPVREERRLSEEDVTARGVRRIVGELVDSDHGVVLCTHRPVLPEVLETLGVETSAMEPGEMLVVHLRKGAVVAVERHLRGR